MKSGRAVDIVPLPPLTHICHQRPAFAVMHNNVLVDETIW
jgi:hypothetical protein